MPIVLGVVFVCYFGIRINSVKIDFWLLNNLIVRYDTNVVESMNNLSTLWMPKTMHPSALQYQLAMKFTDCHAGERHLWDNLGPDMVTWKEYLYQVVADAVGIHVDFLLPPPERRAIRKQVETAAARSRKNRSEDGRQKRNQTKSKRKKEKEEKNQKKDGYVGDGGGFAAAPSGGGGATTNGAARKARKPCDCGGSAQHYNKNSKYCLRNSKHVSNQPVVMDVIMVDVVAEAEDSVDHLDLDVEEKLEAEMEMELAQAEINGIDVGQELGALSDEELGEDQDHLYDEVVVTAR
jgi:hypothetical protein